MTAAELSFCISHYQGDPAALLSCIDGHQYVIYNKSGRSLGQELDSRAITVENIGYNLSSYLRYIISNYSSLPSRVAFVKSDIFPRHISESYFKKTIQSARDFVPLADHRTWEGMNWPASYAGYDNMLYEINNSWYRFHHERIYFSTFNAFLYFFFAVDESSTPQYLRFAPGGNYIVSRERIRSHSITFYQNLLDIISSTQRACENHYLERSLGIIWDSAIESKQRKRLSPTVLKELHLTCQQEVASDYRWRHRLRSLRLKLCTLIGPGRSA
jgi:hypothetical protein